jgi:uncharacterized membrane protein YgcG
MSMAVDKTEGDAAHREIRSKAILGAADWLGLTAAPAFATMALLTSVLGGKMPMICSTAQDALALGGMVPMYLLMSVFHSTPWLKLFASRRRVASGLREKPMPAAARAGGSGGPSGIGRVGMSGGSGWAGSSGGIGGSTGSCGGDSAPDTARRAGASAAGATDPYPSDRGITGRDC